MLLLKWNQKKEGVILSKSKKGIIVLIALILLVIIVDAALIIFSKKEEVLVTEGEQENVKLPEKYKCLGNKQDIQFATMDPFYTFEYENGVIKKQKQGYTFNFVNESYYNQIGKKELFTKENPENMKETLDETNLKKTYEKEIGSTDFVEESDLESFINKIESYGYKCSKE